MRTCNIVVESSPPIDRKEEELDRERQQLRQENDQALTDFDQRKTELEQGTAKVQDRARQEVRKAATREKTARREADLARSNLEARP